jgi:tyrosyl-tRNA synthetase
VLRTALHAIPVQTDNLRFVSASSYQLSKDYTLDNFKLMALVSEDAAKDAGPEVKSASGPSLAALLYPGLQALDEQYLGIDFVFGGPDQVNLFLDIF